MALKECFSKFGFNDPAAMKLKCPGTQPCNTLGRIQFLQLRNHGMCHSSFPRLCTDEMFVAIKRKHVKVYAVWCFQVHRHVNVLTRAAPYSRPKAAIGLNIQEVARGHLENLSSFKICLGRWYEPLLLPNSFSFQKKLYYFKLETAGFGTEGEEMNHVGGE